MSSSSAPKIASNLEEASLKFVTVLKGKKLLELHRQAVLNLRSRGASINEIHEFLRQHDILVSESALTRFCQKYRPEVLRLSLLLEREGEVRFSADTISRGSPDHVTAAPSSPSLNPMPSSTRKMRDLRGDV